MDHQTHLNGVPPLEILLAEPEPRLRADVAHSLGGAGHRVTEAADGAQASRLTEAQTFDIAVLDVALAGVDGLTLLRRLHRQSPRTHVVLLSADPTLQHAIAALQDGALDFVTLPFDAEAFARGLTDRVSERALQQRELLPRSSRPPPAIPDEDPGLRPLIGRSPSILRVLQQVELIAQTDAPVLLTGESGTGKELVARLLHARSPRRSQPFMSVNCAALPETLIEAELFGHERGAFTGADRKRDGRFKAAQGGTLLLDEVAEIPLAAQTKLLRVLQEKTFEPLGSNVSIPVDVRIISASNQNLKELVAQHRFREDLYYRLNVLDLTLPPLRERLGDLPPLLEHFLRRFVPADKAPLRITPEAWTLLSEYPFPGNVRELEHAIEHAVVLAGSEGEIDVRHLPADIVGSQAAPANHGGLSFRTLAAAAQEFERSYLRRALEATHGRRGEAAALLGISRKSLWQKLKAYGLREAASLLGAEPPTRKPG